MGDILKLFRVEQWYKNLLIFAALFFSIQLFDTSLFILCILGFFVLGFVSSAGYMINDILDRNRDKNHPEKKNRPIASGRITVKIALITAFVFYLIGFVSAYLIDLYFFYAVVTLALSTFLYSIYFKNIVFADILFISVNFIIRAMAGVFLIGVVMTPWFLLAILFLAIFLVSGKRYGDLILMGPSAAKYKPVIKEYSEDLLKSMINVNLTGLIIIYGLYVSAIGKDALFYLYPIYIFILFRYYKLILEGHDAIRNPEKFIFETRDYPLIIGALVFGLLALGIFYF
jgi:4-hydroxybenzoate polyprenyltransferase